MSIIATLTSGVFPRTAWKHAATRQEARAYRAEIDGLRAVAVIPVIFFHAGFEAFSGGFVGVDVFFVISGYLITSIIYSEVSERSFSLVRFYERRVRRILPALILVTVACIPFAWLWMMPDEFQDFAQSVVAVNLFSSNILFWRQAGYFTHAAELKPLLHTWSLSVEEQFYVFFPLMLLVFSRFRWVVLLGCFAIMIAASLALAEWSARLYPGANFYLLPTRAWELGIGALLALTASQWSGINGRVAQIASILGVAMIVYAIFAFNETTPFPGLWALVPVLGTALVVAFARPDNAVGKLLSVRVVVGIGLISYSAYLWHQPLFAFARIRSLHELTPAAYLVLTAATLLLAYASWRLVEQPFRNRKRFTRTQVFSMAVAASAALIGFGVVGHLGHGLPNRVSTETIRLMSWADDINPRIEVCHSEEGRFIAPEESCVYGEDPEPRVALIGDSHAMALGNELGKALVNAGHGLRELSYSGCAPFPGHFRFDREEHCPEYNTLAQSYLLESEEIETVVVAARWTLYYDGSRFNNGEGGQEFGNRLHILPSGRDQAFINDPARMDELGELHRDSIARLLESGKRVVLVYMVPEIGWTVPRHLAKEQHFGVAREKPLSISYAAFKKRVDATDRQLDAIPDHPDLLRVRPDRLFCNAYKKGRCVAQLGRDPLYFDDNHLNSIGAAMLSEAIVAAMIEAGWL